MPISLPVSPAQAAHIAQVSRRTIMRAIETKELKAFRDNRNRWKINPSDLDKWAGAQWSPSGHAHQEMPTLPTLDAIEFAAAKAENAQLRERLSATEADRDRWHEAYREATRGGDPILPVAFAVLFAAALASLVNWLAMKDSIMGWLSILLGGALLVMSIAIGDRIRRQHKLKDGKNV